MSIDVSEALKALDNPTRLNILCWLKDPRHHFPEQEVDPELLSKYFKKYQQKQNIFH